MSDVTTLEQLKAAIARHAGADPAFRAALLADPKGEVTKLIGDDLPAYVKIQVVEEAPDTYVVVLPAPASAELSDADLESVAGGATKAEHNANARLGASIVFGGIAGAAILGIGILAKGADDSNHRKITKVGANVASCTPM